jgi:hypothetical protein
MPRLSPQGPAVAVSNADVSTRLFVAATDADGVRLYDGSDHRELGRVAMPVGAMPEIGFCPGMGDPRLIVFARGEATTDVRAFSVPNLQPSGRLEMVGDVVPRAWAGDRILVDDGTGRSPRVVTVSQRGLTAMPIAMREPLQLAAPTPEGRVLMASRDQFETWDVRLGRAVLRLQLPVPRARLAGFSARQRLMWVVAGPTATPVFEVFRVSDGRAKGRLSVPEAVRAVDGQSDAERVLLVGESIFSLVDVQSFESNSVSVEGTPTSVALLEGDAPAVVTVGADGAVRFAAVATSALYATSIGERRATALREAEEARIRLAEQQAERARRPLPPSQKKTPARPAPASAPTTNWRDRLGKPAPETAAEPEVQAEPEAHTEPESTATSVPEDSGDGTWRDRLVALAGELLRGNTRHADVLETGPSGDLASDLHLGSIGRATLGLLYAAWLRGQPLAPVTLVHQLGRLFPDEPAEVRWAEATGVGELGLRGFLRTSATGLRLPKAIGRFLDGAAPATPLVHHDGEMPGQALEPRVYRTALDGTDATARRVARAFGGTVAVIDVRDGAQRLLRGLLEAELCRATPLVLAGEADVSSALEGRVAVVATSGTLPAWLEALPNL